MSRSYYSYNEDWQRRKAILIRSLFHDIQVLSPVTEESNEFITYKPTEDIHKVPPQPIHEDDRPESPLPPLIIERAPNRHDEPEEYYQKLLKKITRIYRKLFVENKDLSIEDWNINSFDSSIHDDNFEMTIGNYDNDASGIYNLDLNDKSREHGNGRNTYSFDNNRESSNSVNSNGYGAGSEPSSSNNEEWIDVEKYSKSEEDVTMRYEEEESSNEQDSSETIDTNESAESDKANDDKVSTEVEETSHLSISNEETDETEQSNISRTKDKQSSKSTESGNNLTENPEFNENIKGGNTEINYPVLIENDTSNNVVRNIRESELKSKESEHRAFDNENQLITTHIEAMDEDIQTNTSSNGTDYMQITTKALVHVDGCQDVMERESRIYEDSVKSLILPTREFRRIINVRNVDVDDRIEELSSLEDNEDPGTTLDSIDSEHITGAIEVMRTPQPRISNESFPIAARSDSDNANEHTRQPENRELDRVTSSPQDGDNDISKPKTSDEMNDILTSIFNESLNKVSETPLRRKRKLYEDISVQTSHRVTWDELSANFFVGTPKVFRLCAFADHICN